jgi:ketosteroid isomerase-like protein
MKRSRQAAIVAAAVVGLAACQPAPPKGPDTAADVATIKASGATWDQSYNAGQADAIVALYADDAVLMPPGAPAAQGSAAMKAYLTADIAQSQAAGLSLATDTTPVTAGASGDLGWRSGTYSVKDKAGATVETGKWLEAWERRSGKWLVIRDIWNSDSKATAAAPAPAAAQ